MSNYDSKLWGYEVGSRNLKSVLPKESLQEVKEVPLTKPPKKDPRAIEKMKFFQTQVNKVFGIKTKVTIEIKGERWALKALSQNRFPLGSTTIWLVGEKGAFGRDILFGTSSGMFTSGEAFDAAEKVRKAYFKKFPRER